MSKFIEFKEQTEKILSLVDKVIANPESMPKEDRKEIASALEDLLGDINKIIKRAKKEPHVSK